MKKNYKNTASTNAPSFNPQKAVVQQNSALTNISKSKTTPWRSLVGLLFFIFMTVISYAQPLPPSTPSGNSVPVGGGVVLLLVALAAMGVKQLIERKKSNE